MGDGKKSGYYWSETYHPWEVFTKQGYKVDFVSLTGKAVPDEHSISAVEQLSSFEVSALAAWKNSSHPIHAAIATIKRPSDINPQDYGIIFFAGGHAAVWDLPTATPLHDISAKIYEHGGVVSAVCHGPAVFGGLKLSSGEYLINGKRATGFTQEEEQKVGALDFLKTQNIPLTGDLITKGGGLYEKGPPFKDYVLEDHRVVTGQNPQSATSTAEKALEVYKRCMA